MSIVDHDVFTGIIEVSAVRDYAEKRYNMYLFADNYHKQEFIEMFLAGYDLGHASSNVDLINEIKSLSSDNFFLRSEIVRLKSHIDTQLSLF